MCAQHLKGVFTTSGETAQASTLYWFNVPERVLFDLLPAVADGTATLTVGAAHEHRLQLAADAEPLTVLQRANAAPIDCYVLDEQRVLAWQGALGDTLTVQAPPVDLRERNRMRQLTSLKQAELKRHQTHVMDETPKEPKSAAAAAARAPVKRPRPPPVIVPTSKPTTTTATSSTSTNATTSTDLHKLLHDLALAPLQRRYVDDKYSSVSQAQLEALAELKNNCWHLKLDQYDAVDLNYAAWSPQQRLDAQKRIAQAHSISGGATSAATAAAAAAARDQMRDAYESAWIEHATLHRELEEMKKRFLNMSSYLDQATMASFKDSVDPERAFAELDRDEPIFRQKLDAYKQMHVKLARLEARFSRAQTKN